MPQPTLSPSLNHQASTQNAFARMVSLIFVLKLYWNGFANEQSEYSCE